MLDFMMYLLGQNQNSNNNNTKKGTVLHKNIVRKNVFLKVYRRNNKYALNHRSPFRIILILTNTLFN